MASILEFKGAKRTKLYSWARYLFWADLHRQRFDDWMAKETNYADKKERWMFIALFSAWCASLWVVLEGWEEIPLADPEVDRILKATPELKKLLKRFRNGVYHFQPSLTDARHMDFLRERRGVHLAHLLHDNFCRFYWELFQDRRIPEDLRVKIADGVTRIIGWSPQHIPEVQIDELRRMAHDGAAKVSAENSQESPHGRELLKAVEECLKTADSAEREFANWRSSTLAEIKEDGAHS